MTNQANKLNVFMSIKAFFLLITLFSVFFLAGCGGDAPNTTNAATPTITVQPISATYTQGDIAAALNVTANVSDGGVLSYQWYNNTINSNQNGTPISGETSSSFTPSTSGMGTTYYYAVVTNTNDGVNGNKTADVASVVVDVLVIANAKTPKVTVQPVNATYAHDKTAAALNVTANVSDGGVLSYQWYNNTINSNQNGTPISGETSSSFTPSTSTVGIVYYYVTVTNTNDNVNGIKTANVSSDTAQIAISYSVSFYDENLDHIKTVNTTEKIINLSNTSNTSNPWYKTNSTLPLTADYTLTNDERFYAVPNVQEITTQDELAAINTDATTLNGKYILLNDIDLDETGAGFDREGWVKIGNHPNIFTGIFNGNFNNITNLWINSTTNIFLGFFSYIANATIRNLNINTAEGKRIGNFMYIGGIVGNAEYSSITNSCFAGDINGHFHVGGIVGDASYSNITNSCSSGNINGDNVIAGIVASAQESSVKNSYSTANLNGNNTISGIVGDLRDHSSVTNSYSTANISGNYTIGGIAGLTAFSNITNSYSNGNVSGKDGIASIVAYGFSGTVQNNAAISPSIIGDTDVNRIFGYTRLANVLKSSNNFALDTMVGGAKYNGTTNSFSDRDNIDYHGVDRTQIELKTQTTYSDAINGNGLGGLGWKFGDDDDNPWKIDPNKNNGYPYLYWQKL
jgi:hypothetical protein